MDMSVSPALVVDRVVQKPLQPEVIRGGPGLRPEAVAFGVRVIPSARGAKESQVT